MTRLVLVLVLVAAASACGNNTAPTVVTTTAPYSATDLVAGTGALAVNGSRVTVGYTGWLHDSSRPDAKGTQFESNPAGYTFCSGPVPSSSAGIAVCPACVWVDSVAW